MSSQITDTIRLLGLIVTTKPFNYQDNVVTSEYTSYVDIDGLKQIKSDIQMQIDSLAAETPDHQRIDLQDDLYFITTVIEAIESNQ